MIQDLIRLFKEPSFQFVPAQVHLRSTQADILNLPGIIKPGSNGTIEPF